MKLSRFFHGIRIKKDIYAIYNSLVMNIIYVNKKTYDKVLNFDVSKNEMKILKNSGIYVENKQFNNRKEINISCKTALTALEKNKISDNVFYGY